MIRLTKNQIFTLHNQLLMETGGCCGVRDENLLDFALETPFHVLAIVLVLKFIPTM